MLAVSGGPDSTALLVLAAQWHAHSPQDRPRLCAATVDHRWRPQSRAEAEAVGALCDRLGVPHTILTVADDMPATGIEAAGRVSRYHLLFGLSRTAGSALVTAHTLDDQAETVLMRLAAGSGPAGLAAMRPLRVQDGVRHFRPLLDTPKARLVALLDAAGTSYVRDPGNADLRLARGRLRGSVGALEREGLSAQRLAVLAKRMARLDLAIETEVDRVQADCGCDPDAVEGPLHIPGGMFLALPDEIALRLLSRCIAGCGDGAPPLAGLERLFAALRSSLQNHTPLGRTLAGTRVAIAHGDVQVARAPPRRMPSAGRNPAPC